MLFIFSILSFFSVFAHACPEIAAPVIVNPTKSFHVIVDPRHEVIFDGKNHTPKLLFIESVETKDRPRLNVMTGLQILEDGKMKSYPYRISVKLPQDEQQGTPKKIRLMFAPTALAKTKSSIPIVIEYVAYQAEACKAAQVLDLKK